ncbi:Hypothetical protein, putative, partial [Bodo saltans]
MTQTTDVKRILKRVGGASPSSSSSEEAGGDVSSSPVVAENWLVQIRIPFPNSSFGARVASGRGPDKKTAIACACMHAELTIDAVGVALYRQDVAQQRQHAEECAMVGRWATDVVDDSKLKLTEPSPAPLRFATSSSSSHASAPSVYGGSTTTTTVELDGSGSSAAPSQNPFEIVLALHTAALRDAEHVIRLPTIDRGAVRDIRQYLARYLAGSGEMDDDDDDVARKHHNQKQQREGSRDEHVFGASGDDDQLPMLHLEDSGASETCSSGSWVAKVSSLFLTQPLGLKGRETYRTTLSVPLPDPIEIWYDVAPLRRKKQELVAIGVGPTQETSEAAAAMHALQLLGTLGVPLYTSDGDQAAFAARVRHLGGAAVSSVMGAKPLAGQTKDVAWSRYVERCVMKYVGTAKTDDIAAVGRVVCPGNASSNDQINISGNDLQHHFDEQRQKQQQQQQHAKTSPNVAPSQTAAETNAPSFNIAQRRLNEKSEVGKAHNPRCVWSLAPDYPPPEVVLSPETATAITKKGDSVSLTPTSAHPPADASACILLHPTASSARYCHTFRYALGSVRTLDPTAIERAQDYFERHGMDLQQRWMLTTAGGDTGVTPPLLSASCGVASGTAAAAVAADRHLHGGGGAQESLVVAQLRVPVPPNAGPRVAIGRGTSREEAQILCAMHLEILLDEIGVPMFDYIPLQRRHAEAVASFGRRAPFDNCAVREWATAPSPPPLVKPWESSTLWLRFLKSVVGMAAEVGTNDAAEYYHWHPHRVLCRAGGGGGAHDLRTCDDMTYHNADAALIAGMIPMAEANIVIVLKNYLAQYLERHSQSGLDNVEVDMRISQRAGPTGHPIFHATLPITIFPKEYQTKFAGQYRVAHACASTRRNAFFLCAMHAVHMLDIMGIPVMGHWSKQPMHADYQLARGWWAPRTQEESDAVAADVATPPGLKCLELGADVSMMVSPPSVAAASSSSMQSVTFAAGLVDAMSQKNNRKHSTLPNALSDDDVSAENDGSASSSIAGGGGIAIPTPPDPSRLSSDPTLEVQGGNHTGHSILWTGYVKQCRAYIAAKEESLWYHSAMIQKKAPRTGDALVDEGLDAVEALKFDNHAKSDLVRLCQSLHLPAPERYELASYGRAPHKMFVVHQAIQGTP